MRNAGIIGSPSSAGGDITPGLAVYIGATVHAPTVVASSDSFIPDRASYAGATVHAPTLAGQLRPAVANYAGASAHQPAVTDVSSMTELDEWADNGDTVSLASPGSFTVSAGSDRLLVARTVTTGGTAIPVTALSWGGEAMTLVDEETSTGGRDMHTAVWILDETGIAAAGSTAFAVTPASGAVQFRIQAGSYQNADQSTPVVASFAVSSTTAGVDPTSEALTTEPGGIVLAATAINRGTDDAGTEDMAYSNLTEQVENLSTGQYSSIGEADALGSDFTPSITSTQTSGRVHLIGVSFRPVIVLGLLPAAAIYAGATIHSPTVHGQILPDRAEYAGATVHAPTITDSAGLAPDRAAYAGATAHDPTVSGEVRPALAMYAGASAHAPSLSGQVLPGLASYVGATAHDPTLTAIETITPDRADYAGATAHSPALTGSIAPGLASYTGATAHAPTVAAAATAPTLEASGIVTDSDGGTTRQFTVSVPSSLTDSIIVFAVDWFNGTNSTVSSVTYNSSSTGITTIGSDQDANRGAGEDGMALRYLLNPTSGSQEIEFTFSSDQGGDTCVLAYWVFSGADQTTPIDVSTTPNHEGSTSSYNGSLTTTVDNCALGFAVWDFNEPTNGSVSGWTQLTTTVSFSEGWVLEDAGAAGEKTWTWSGQAGSKITVGAFAVAPA